jgi:glucan phosphorylase
MVGGTLVHRQGYFRQRFDADGRQKTDPMIWTPERRLAELDPAARFTLTAGASRSVPGATTSRASMATSSPCCCWTPI